MLWGSFAACAAKHVFPFGAFERLVALFKVGVWTVWRVKRFHTRLWRNGSSTCLYLA